MKFRIELNYGFVQGLYWVCSCCLTGFTTVYLSYRGVADNMIGYLTSIIALASILLQLFISKFCDNNPNLSLKKIILTMYCIAISACVIFHFLAPWIAVILIFYTISAVFNGSAYGLINALYIRYTQAGYDVDYGWPRGFGSIGYAVIAYFIGSLTAKYNAGVIMVLYLGFSIFSIMALWLMPDVNVKIEKKPEVKQISYLELLKKNKTLCIFLVAAVLSSMSTAGVYTYLIRIIENAGKGTVELGIAMLIQAGVEIPTMFTSRKIMRHFKPVTLLSISFIAVFIKVLLLTFASNMALIYFAMALSILCYGIFGFASVYFVNEIVKKEESVRGQSLVTLCYNSGIGSILGGLLMGKLIVTIGLKGMLYVSLGICAISVLFMLLCNLSYNRTVK